MRGRFQSFESGNSRSETFKSFVSSVGGPIGLRGSDRDSQGLFQTEVAFPFPITLPIRGFSKSRPIHRLLHPWEAVFETVQFRKGDDLQYLPNSTLARRQSGFDNNLQLSFARRALLKVLMSLKPRPLCLKDLVIFLQEIQHIFFFPALESHQKRVRADCILLHREFGSLKQVIV